MDTIVKISDIAVAKGMLEKAKDKQFHHNLMLARLVEVGECSCKELEAWLEANKGTLMDEAHRAPWDKYSAPAHMSYFVNRSRGALTAWKTDGTQVAQTATKVKKVKVEAEVAVEEAAPVTADEAALATAE
jgi:hypothetical protein